ncbi:hypothetical protein [Aromatoleum petrolei]|uniref:Uncharacterized protein n=1 Tax=Aromatoleum petrolei TaxID=76116 RepID=A0ABX1MJJ3_9RHOO|nr:hypothetical protein [Aromatoleum petrolei]NMF88118.1 hypothetical protein [Aromatoleum petrolei]QTQ38904.1 Uncharacterized protein ToN1_48100 [Aromatoleum petrolei]
MNFEIDPRLAHLDAAQLTALIDRYHAGEQVIDLLTEFQIPCAPSQLSRLLPPKRLPDRQWVACAAPLIQGCRSRPGAPASEGSVRGSAGAHRVAEFCEGTVRVDRAIEGLHHDAMQRRAANEAYCRARWNYAERVHTPDDLRLAEAVALLTVVRCGGWIANGSVGAVGYSAVPLAPAGPLGSQLLSSLVAARVIAPDMESPVEAFSATDVELPAYPYVTYWRILAPSPMSLVEQIEHAAACGEWPDTWRNALGDLRLMLALAECQEFADFCLMQGGLPDAPEVATDALLRDLLRDFSVAQCFRILRAGAHATSDFVVRKRANRRHAANYFVGECQRWADRARTEGWALEPGSRNNNYPRSQLSHVLYDVFLGIGEKGFVEPLGV